MPTPKKTPSKETADSEEYKRFLETAKQVEASEDAEAFDRAFKKVIGRKPKATGESPSGFSR